MNKIYKSTKAEISPEMRDHAFEPSTAGKIAVNNPLLTEEIRTSLPALRTTEFAPDPIAQVKFFTPDGEWTWFVVEFDGDDTFFGLVKGFEDELGYFSLSELQEIRGRLGLPVERDLSFEPTPLSRL